MQPVEVLPPRQRVSRSPQRIEAGATGDQQRWFVAEFVCCCLEQVLPLRRLMELVQYNERSVLGPRGLPDDPAIFRNVPTEVLAALIQQRLGECRLPTLTWTGEKHHFLTQILRQSCGEVSHLAILKEYSFWSRLL